MQAGRPSFTAFRAAAHRAAHQALEAGRIFADPLAEAVLGTPAHAVFGKEIDTPATRAMRRFVAARSRFAEEGLAAAAARGVRQYVVLGAGLDTFAHRNPFAGEGLKVFEVDHPATQAWKRRRLAEAGLLPPESLVFAPADFERETVGEALAKAGFAEGKPSFFAWLGVLVYLTREAAAATLAFIGALSGVRRSYSTTASPSRPIRPSVSLTRSGGLPAWRPWASRGSRASPRRTSPSSSAIAASTRSRIWAPARSRAASSRRSGRTGPARIWCERRGWTGRASRGDGEPGGAFDRKKCAGPKVGKRKTAGDGVGENPKTGRRPFDFCGAQSLLKRERAR